MDNKDRVDVVGVISIVAAATGILTPIGFALGLYGVRRAKKQHRSLAVSRAGWIFNLAIILLSIAWVVLVLITGAYKTGK